MYGFLLTFLVLDGIFLILVILLQSGKGGGLAAMGGGVTAAEGVLGGRQAATFLTRASWVAGSAFMVLSLVLAIVSSRGQQPTSILEGGLEPTTVPSPVVPGIQPAPAESAPETGGEAPTTLP
ncbi:MAG: preprotein translocase subunit SecG [Gemmatimonadota bacterium]